MQISNRFFRRSTVFGFLNAAIKTPDRGETKGVKDEFIEHEGEKLKKNDYPHYPYVIGKNIKDITDENNSIEHNKDYCINRMNNEIKGFHITDKDECVKVANKTKSKFIEVFQDEGFPGCFTEYKNEELPIIYWNNKFRSTEEKFISGLRILNKNHAAVCNFNKPKIICKSKEGINDFYKNLRFYKEREPLRSCNDKRHNFGCWKYYNVFNKKHCKRPGHPLNWLPPNATCIDDENTCIETIQ